MAEELRLDPDPFEQFERWLGEARQAEQPEPAAMALATARPDGAPSARMVILRGFDTRGFVFYTDSASPKAADLAANPRAALVFHWAALERQVRVEGAVGKVSGEESDHFFASRPHGAQLAAWISPQSQVVADRAELEACIREIERRYPDRIPRPPFWGGYRLDPAHFEFWQGCPDRLHDRFRYRREANGRWLLERLAP